MAWTEENTKNVPSVFSQCYGEKETQEGSKDVLSSFRETEEVDSRGKVRVVLVYTH